VLPVLVRVAGVNPHSRAGRTTSNDHSPTFEALSGFVFSERVASICSFSDDHVGVEHDEPVANLMI
jgi:hypothetical protein